MTCRVRSINKRNAKVKNQKLTKYNSETIGKKLQLLIKTFLVCQLKCKVCVPLYT